METTRACTIMLTSENDDFKFLKTTKKHVMNNSSRARTCRTFSSLQTSLMLTRNMNVKLAIRAVLHIFQNIEI